MYNSKLKQLYIDSLISINFSRYRKGIKFDQDPLAVEQNSYEIKIVNAYIVYDWDTWSKILSKNLKLKNCLLGAANIVKIVIKKWVCSGYRIAFDGAGSWGSGNDNVRNVMIITIHHLILIIVRIVFYC